MKSLINWLDRRTGCRRLTRSVLYENVPGGARWRYVWGSALTFALMVQFITGIFLWTAYSPSAQSAWESVFYIQHEMTGGWLLRGIHHYTTQVMIVLLVLHLMQVVIDGAYRAPRELNFWMGIVLLVLTLALSLTGYLLPWDQKGYWATKVTTSLMSMAPVIGPGLQKLIVGGTEYGHHTLTRFFALHAGLLPALVVLLLAGHIYLFRVHGLTPKRPLKRPDEKFWPDQLLRDAVAALAVMGAVLFLVLRPRLFGETGELSSLGAHLGAPANPTEPYSAARPEWYFLFLFQFLKYFPGEREVWGAIIIPGLTLGFLFLMPFIGRWKLGHGFNVLFVCAVLAGATYLTVESVRQDRADPSYVAAVEEAERAAERVQTLARAPSGIPVQGAAHLLKGDILTQGPLLFAKHCSSCHRYEGHDGTGAEPSEPPSAPDLKGFASRQWLSDFFDPQQITNLHFFGGTRFADGKMARTVKELAEGGPEVQQQLEKAIIALSAEANLKSQREADRADTDAIDEGREAIRDALACTDCHQFRRPDPTSSAPDLTGYGSREWLIGIIQDPSSVRFYGRRNDRMPPFGHEILDQESIEMLADWLREDWYMPEENTAADASVEQETSSSEGTPDEAPPETPPDEGKPVAAP